MQKNQIIDYEEVFPNEEQTKLTRTKLPYIIVLIIYGVFFLFNFISAFSPMTELDLLVSTLKNSDDHVILILDEEEKTIVDEQLDSLNVVTFYYNGISYHAASKNEDVGSLQYSGILTNRSDVTWPDGTNIVVLYGNSLTIKEYAINNDYFVDVQRNLPLINLIAFLILLIPIFIILFKDIKFDFLVFLKDKNYSGWSKFGSGILPLFLVSIGSGLIVATIGDLLNIISTSQNQEVIEQMFAGNAKLIMFVTVVLIAPVLEELVFRKSIFKMFENKKIAIIVSGITFGLIHLTIELVSLFTIGFGLRALAKVLLLTVPYVSMGLFFSYYYNKTEENITIPILLHALINFVSALGLLL